MNPPIPLRIFETSGAGNPRSRPTNQNHRFLRWRFVLHRRAFRRLARDSPHSLRVQRLADGGDRGRNRRAWRMDRKMKLAGYNSRMETTIDSFTVDGSFASLAFFARARASILAIVVASADGGRPRGLRRMWSGWRRHRKRRRRRRRRRAGLNPAYFHGDRVEGLQYQYERRRQRRNRCARRISDRASFFRSA